MLRVVTKELVSRLKVFSINIIPEGSPNIVLQQLSNIVLMDDPFKKKKGTLTILLIHIFRTCM